MSIQDITVVITSFKSDSIIKKCLKSIDTQCKIILVENSNDLKFKKEIESEFNNVECVLTKYNLGYGKANNIALKEVKTKYALILNPDAELNPKALGNFLALAQETPDFALIGPNVKENKKKTNLRFEESENLLLLKAKIVKGYAMFLNLSQFKEVGFFDENFFIYLEEIDLCRRLLKNNKKIYWCPNILINHQGGKSHDGAVNRQMELSRNWHWMWSTFYYNKKYKGFFISILIILPKLFSAIMKIFIYLLVFNKKKKEIYYHRLSGLFNAIMGKSSWYRPKV